jgi:DNA replication protein DnaC
MPLETVSRIGQLASDFRLPTVAKELAAKFLAQGHLEALETLRDVFEMEAQDRLERRVDRLRRASKLPPGKTLETLDLNRYPKPLQAKIAMLAQGEFVERGANIVAFGLPGVGKSHVASGIGHALVSAGHSVLYTKTVLLIQELLAAKEQYGLPNKLRKLDNFDVLILDDIGYTQQNADEVEVLFTLLAERYERRSVVITSNLVFSQWDQIFKNPMTTAAAIDRVVHHSTILEFNVSSYRTKRAQKGPKTENDESSVKPEDSL